MFIEREFPRMFSIEAQGGPGYMTDVKQGDSGFEQRNSKWATPLAVWAIAFNARSQEWYDALQDFFHAVKGRGNTFRFFWHADCSAEDEFVATGDGITTVFQLQKTYADSFNEPYVRPIFKPITADVLDYLGAPLEDNLVVKRTRNGATTELIRSIDYTVDYTTGRISMTDPPKSASQNMSDGHGSLADIISWSGQFHWPARLDIDQLAPRMLTPADGGILFSLPDISIKETRIPDAEVGGS